MKDIRAPYSRVNLSTFLIAEIAAITLVFIAAAQEKAVNLNNIPITYTNPASGSEMYTAYCAACHGTSGQGNGPAASIFKKPPTDLTMLARNNQGKYPAQHVYMILKFGTPVPAHGNIKMPVWYPLFRSLNSTHEASATITRLRMNNLVEYIQSIQAK